MRFGVFKSQNFEPTPLSLSVLSASLEERYISQVVDARGNIRSMVQALCEALNCAPQALEQRLADYSFAIRVGDEVFVRSIAQIDFANERVHLFCDVAPGEELIMVKRTPLAEATRRDYQRFMRGKPGKPLVAFSTTASCAGSTTSRRWPAWTRCSTMYRSPVTPPLAKSSA